MKSILIHGWYARIFILVLWLVALWLRFTIDFEQKSPLLISLLGLSNLSLYLIVSMRLPLLTHSQIAAVLPGFSSQLKTALISILLISFLPTLLLLPNVMSWLGLLSIMLVSAMLMIAMVYQPKYQILFFLIMLTPLCSEALNIEITFEQVMSYFAFALPVIAVWAWQSLNKLVVYRKHSEHIAKMMLMVNASIDRTLVAQDHIPPATQNIFMRWWSNLNFNHERSNITEAEENKTKLSMRKLIAISCQSTASFSKHSYIAWSLATLILCGVALFIDEKNYVAVIPMITIVPAILIGTASITLFQMVNNKRSYLARLSILPRFKNKQTFAKAFVKYVLVNQASLLVFVAFLVAITVITFEHLTWVNYMKVCLLALLFCLLNCALMFFSWSNHSQAIQKYVFIIVFNFFLFLLASLEVMQSGVDSIISWMPIFITIFTGAIFCGYTIKRYTQRYAGLNY
ncbi:hypothetical protein [Colwellia sp. RSH04]|uniref:hypothetical protein n=1 Tax=Colwellia sp. RSH04 TaxID=2305464 RepID=UPI000E56C26A|nr:hypothetical protein [Colwellia sp. RSH04]RHW75201.1 hypothetical protein D1094_15205 [Colwellia sp. RSH04]